MVVFTPEECRNIISLSTTLTEVRRDENPRLISYFYYSLGFSESYKWIFDRFDCYIENQLKTKVVKQLDTIHLFRYEKGDQFLKHKDIYYPGQVYNVGACLNDSYEGGDFLLYEPEYERIRKKVGHIYGFKNSYSHEITPITEGVRWSLIGFYFYENLTLTPPSI